MPARGPKVLVAMSGGVDSSVAAALLVRAGFDVVGCFMRLGSPGETLDELIPDEQACEARPGGRAVGGGGGGGGRPLKIGHQGCCSITDAADARLVAAELGIPLYVCNFKRDFGRIIDYFVDEYAAGRTPNPCVRCNDWLKFGKLHDYAASIGAEYIASGHYARVEPSVLDGPSPAGEPRLLRGIDPAKDQSYVLFGVPRDRIGRMVLPIGRMHKPAVRDLAQRLGLPVFDKPDSQEICFVPDNDYAGLVERRRPESARPGAVVDTGGREVGEHAGQHRFTIGQRRGVGLALGRPVFVVGKDAAANTVTVGPREKLLARACTAAEANWLIDPPHAGAWMNVHAKFRSKSEPVPARVRVLADAPGPTPSGRTGAFEVEFAEPQFAVAPGQAIVLYGGSEWGNGGDGAGQAVLGGGWISSAAGAAST